MAVPSNTQQTFGQVGIREDLIEAIYNVDPFKTPFLNMCKKGKATQTLHEWETDSLAAQSLTNAAVQGDNPTNIALAATVRLGNNTQISTKTIQISGTSQAVVAAGGSNKMGYQLLKKSKELKRDMEGILTNNQAKNAGNSSTATKLAGWPSWCATNETFNATSGADPGALDGTATRTYSSAQTALAEADVKTVLQKVYNSSGDSPEYALMSAKNKQNFSAFAGPGTRFIQVKDATLLTKVDIYESDFGDIKLIPDIFLSTSKNIMFVNPNYVRVCYLRPFQTIPLAKTGDSDQKELLVEYTLELGNEKAQGTMYDTTG